MFEISSWLPLALNLGDETKISQVIAKMEIRRTEIEHGRIEHVPSILKALKTKLLGPYS